MKKKIYYHDTDAGGVVYYANYLKYLEEARTELLAQKNILVKELSQKNTLFVVSRQEINYKLPAVYADILQIDTKISKISAVRIEFDYEIRNQKDQLLSCAKTTLVCVDSKFKPKPIPEDIRSKLS